MENNTQNRFRSWALWASVAGALWTIMSAFGVTEAIGLTESVYTQVLDAVGAILIAFGIVNNPTDKNHL